MKRFIHIQKADREFIMKALKVTERTVFNAIRFDESRGGSDTARRIRKLAMDRGGIVMVEVPEVETLFDADGYLHQYFQNGAMLELSKVDGSGRLYFKGRCVWQSDKVLMSHLDEIQNRAAALR